MPDKPTNCNSCEHLELTNWDTHCRCSVGDKMTLGIMFAHGLPVFIPQLDRCCPLEVNNG